MLKEFKEFAAKGNMLDMAVGIVIGAAFATIISSLVNDIIMPPIGMALGGVDFSEFYVLLKQGATAGPYATLAAAKEAGAVTLNWGIFVNALISFVIVAFALFMVIKGFNKNEGRGRGCTRGAARAVGGREASDRDSRSAEGQGLTSVRRSRPDNGRPAFLLESGPSSFRRRGCDLSGQLPSGTAHLAVNCQPRFRMFEFSNTSDSPSM